MSDLMPRIVHAERASHDQEWPLNITVLQGDTERSVTIHKGTIAHMPGRRMYVAVCDRWGCEGEERMETREGVTEDDVVTCAVEFAVTHYCHGPDL